MVQPARRPRRSVGVGAHAEQHQCAGFGSADGVAPLRCRSTRRVCCGTGPARPGSSLPTAAGNANSARTSVCSASAAAKIGQRARRCCRCRSGTSTGVPVVAASMHAPSFRVNCSSSSSSAVGSVAHSVSRDTVRGEQRDRRAVDVQPGHARPADLLGQGVLRVRSGRRCPGARGSPRPGQPPGAPAAAGVAPRTSTLRTSFRRRRGVLGLESGTTGGVNLPAPDEGSTGRLRGSLTAGSSHREARTWRAKSRSAMTRRATSPRSRWCPRE